MEWLGGNGGDAALFGHLPMLVAVIMALHVNDLEGAAMPISRVPPSDADIKKWFIDVPDVDPGTFEFALVLGGTVSAGAYTAGAVDFLIEALDCLSHAQRQGRAPQHKVLLKLIAGTSGGGVNAAIAARTLAFDYPYAARATSTSSASGNLFYDTWVNTLRLDKFLDTSDIGKDLISLLNGKPIDDSAAAIIRFANGPAKAREWVAAPLRIILTLTSLRGVPYRTNFGDKLSQGYVDHADFIRFAVLYPGQSLGEVRPDELVLGFGAERLPQAADWEQFSEFARATAAFPVGLPTACIEPSDRTLSLARRSLPSRPRRANRLHDELARLGCDGSGWRSYR